MSLINLQHVPGLKTPPFQVGDSRGEHTMLYIAPVVRFRSRFWGWVYAIALVVDSLVVHLPRAIWMYLAHRWQGGCPRGMSCRLVRVRPHVEVVS